MDITILKTVSPINCLSQSIDENSDDFKKYLDRQLILQKELYDFFGSQPLDVIKNYLMFVPKGSLFFHGDNINEPEILYTKLDIPEKTTFINEDGLEVYQYKVNKQEVFFDGPVVKITTTNEATGIKIENTIPQTTALLSKASNLRLVSNIKYSYEESIKKIADIKWVRGTKTYTLKDPNNQVNKELLDLCLEIDQQLDFIYNTSEEALYRKQKQKFVVFDQEWARRQTRDKYVYQDNDADKKYLTNKLLNDLNTDLENKIVQFYERNPEYKNEIKSYHINCREYYVLISKPEDEFLKPPAKTQLFGNPCAETNIALAKGSSTTDLTQIKTDAKYLYSMQVYMFQNNIFLLDYWKLVNIFLDYPDSFKESMRNSPRATGIDKRSMFWGTYFKGIVDSSENIKGIFTLPFNINPNINLTSEHSYNDKTYNKLTSNYNNYNNGTYTYKLRNYQSNEDSPIITHLNFILNLRGFSMSIQGYTDFDPAESYIIPSYKHPRVLSLFKDEDVIGISSGTRGMICREYTIFNSPDNLLFLCYSTTLPNYRTPATEAVYNTFFNTGSNVRLNKQTLIDENNKLSDTDGDMFIDFSQPALFNPTARYSKFSVDIFANKFEFGSNSTFLNIIKKKYTNPNGLQARKDVPQFSDLQKMLDECLVRKNIYNTILKKLSNIKYIDKNQQKWKLSFINSNLFEENPLLRKYPNHFKGLKLIFISENLTLQDYCSYSDNQIVGDQSISNKFRMLTELDFSNLINNVNAGKIENFNSDPYKAFEGEEKNLIDYKLQLQTIKQHNTNDYGHNHFSGALFELIRYNYNCPNNWQEMSDKMSPIELNICSDIASKISNSKEKLIQDITSLDPATCSNGNQKCLERINKIVELYNANSMLIKDQEDDIDPDI